MKYVCISLGVMLGFAIIIGGVFFWHDYKESRKNNIISLVKDCSWIDLERERHVRSGIFGDIKDFENLPEGSKNIIRKKTINDIRSRDFKELRERGETVGPFIWDAWQLDKNKWLVGSMFAKVDESGDVVGIIGSFFEIRTIKNEYFIRWLLWKKNESGEYLDPLTKKYAEKIAEIKQQYIRFWKD